jgi:hypothetical protein
MDDLKEYGVWVEYRDRSQEKIWYPNYRARERAYARLTREGDSGGDVRTISRIERKI